MDVEALMFLQGDDLKGEYKDRKRVIDKSSWHDMERREKIIALKCSNSNEVILVYFPVIPFQHVILQHLNNCKVFRFRV